MEFAVNVENVSKIIRGRKILNNVTLQVRPGEAVGIIGRNGSGKSMLFKAICGLILPTSGSITVFDKPVGKNGHFPADTGVLIEQPGLLPQYSGYKNLKMLADIQHKVGKKECLAALKLVGLDHLDKRPVRKYSLGMKQRLGIAQALMEKPNLLILDEPFNGLDSSGVKELQAVLQGLIGSGVTLLLTSHHREDIDLLCKTIYYMDKGIMCAGETEPVTA